MTIVAEISKSYRDGSPCGGPEPLALLFEKIINTNWRRGYVLTSWQLHRLMVRPNEINETIIAVFEKRHPPIADDVPASFLNSDLRIQMRDAVNKKEQP